MAQNPTDTLKRPLHDLRISVIDACNFRCGYCMPADQQYEFLARDERLSFDQIEQIAKAFVRAGVKKIRITGGEPLLRPNIERLVAAMSLIDGLEDLSMTTNAYLLKDKAALLKQAGLKRLTISCDSIREATFLKMSGYRGSAAKVLEAIDSALDCGFESIKVNCVVQKGVNDSEIAEMIDYFGPRGVILRFIEYMDVGNRNAWEQSQVVFSRSLLETLKTAGYKIEPLQKNYFGEVAGRYLVDNRYEIGFISSVSNPFCQSCTRARLSTEGHVFTCLFASEGTDLRGALQKTNPDQALDTLIHDLWGQRTDRYSEIRNEATTHERPKIEMYQIGG